LAKSVRRDALIRSLTITLGENLSSDTISRVFTSSVMRIHVNTAAGSWRERLQQLKVNLRVMNTHEGKYDQSPASQMFSNEGVDSFAVLESIKQRR
jgi:hypothetical protein